MNGFKVVAKNIRTPDQFAPITLDSRVVSSGGIDDINISFAEHYSLQVTIGVDFIANNAMLVHATENAMKQVTRTLNDETIHQLFAIKAAIYEGDRNKALALCGILESTLMGQLK